MKVNDLFINAKNIVTLLPFISLADGMAGLQINGNNIVFERFEANKQEDADKALAAVKEIQEKLITEMGA